MSELHCCCGHRLADHLVDGACALCQCARFENDDDEGWPDDYEEDADREPTSEPATA